MKILGGLLLILVGFLIGCTTPASKTRLAGQYLNVSHIPDNNIRTGNYSNGHTGNGVRSKDAGTYWLHLKDDGTYDTGMIGPGVRDEGREHGRWVLSGRQIVFQNDAYNASQAPLAWKGGRPYILWRGIKFERIWEPPMTASIVSSASGVSSFKVSVPAAVSLDPKHPEVTLVPAMEFRNTTSAPLEIRSIGSVMDNVTAQFEILDPTGKKVPETGRNIPGPFPWFGGRVVYRMLLSGQTIAWISDEHIRYAISKKGGYRLVAHLRMEDPRNGRLDFDSNIFPFSVK